MDLKLSNQPLFGLDIKTDQRDIKSPVTSNSRNSHTDKLIVWYKTKVHWKQYNAQNVKCGRYTCIFSTNTSYLHEADAVVFHAWVVTRTSIKETPLRIHPDQVWVFFTLEPWANYRNQFPGENWNSVFNWTYTYERKSDFHASYGHLRRRQKLSTINWNQVMRLKTKKVLWFVSNCGGSSNRMQYVDELKKYIPVDIIGDCGRPNCTVDGKEDSCYRQYKFYLSFESNFCKDYVTEKFLKTFQNDRHIIPVVRGNGDYAKHYPKDTYLNTADFRSPKDLGAHLSYLDKNTSVYLDLLKTHAQYEKVPFKPNSCEMCISLHTLDQHRKSYPDISGWMDTCESRKDY
ncbi:glycoprotein 3-alpha-L-fucosyltransferase A-like [Haliotis cracherodii]|uniref:glycoprotein 3-alpha-L-fucosyltransferase A-like n=1 Tax=Haliotis cracherodii TaxID=6455 RepID=UPI0039EC9F9A